MSESKKGLLYRVATSQRQHLAQGSVCPDATESCPSDMDIMNVALQQEAECNASVERHAVACEHCGAALDAIRLMLQRKSPPLKPWNDPVAAWLAKGGGVTKTPVSQPQNDSSK